MSYLLFEFKTIHISKFKFLVDALKEIMLEANFEFSKSGIKISKVNSSATIGCVVNMQKDQLINDGGSSYSCDYPYRHKTIDCWSKFITFWKNITNNCTT